MKGSLFAGILATIVIAGSAAAATPGKDMASAMRALRYPKAGAIKVGCRHTGAMFRCKSTYRHHRHRVFYAGWAALGGWICAGPKPVGCKMLRHGFVPTDQIQANGSVEFSAELAARGYMQIHYNDPNPYISTGCQSPPPSSSTWSFCYALDTGSISVTVHMGHVKTGYVTTASGTVT